MVVVPFSYEIRNGTLFISGYLDERADFYDVGSFDAVNLQSVSGFSTLGLRQFLQFLYGNEAPRMPLKECPVSFVEAVNAISGLIKGSKIVIESIQVPFRCDACNVEVEALVQCGDISFQGAKISVPPQRCHRCREQLRLVIDPHDFFLFLYN